MGSSVQVPWSNFSLWQDQLLEGFKLFSSCSQEQFLLCSPTQWRCQCTAGIQEPPPVLDQLVRNGRAVFWCLEQSIPGELDTPLSKSILWPELCFQKDWEKSIHSVSFGIQFGCLCLQLLSGRATCNSDVTSLRPQLSTVRQHFSMDFCTCHMGLLKGKRVLLISPWFSSWRISSWMEIRESRLVWYCCQCTTVLATTTCSSILSNITTEESPERLGKVDSCLISSASKATILKATSTLLGPWSTLSWGNLY